MLLFVALQLLDGAAGGWIGRAAGLLMRTRPRLEEREAMGAPYRLIVAPRRGGAPDWGAIAALAEGEAVLLPDRVRIPGDSPVRPLCCPRFAHRVLLATACEAVRRTRMPMYRRVVGLLDPEGRYTAMLFPLLHHYTAVRAVTGAVERYARAAGEITARLGAPVQFGPDTALLDDCVLVLAPDPVELPARPLPCPVLAATQVRAPAEAEVFSELRVSVKPELAALSPPGISPHRFAAALYEHGGAEPGGYVAGRMLRNGLPSDMPECVQAVMQRIGRLF